MIPRAAFAWAILLGCGGAAPERPRRSLLVEIERVDRTPEPEPEPVPLPEPEPVPLPVPAVRRAGDLVVHSPPRARAADRFGGRLRTDVEGALSRGSERVWVGIDVPAFVELAVGTQELFLLDRMPDGLLAFYRDPYDSSSCTLGGARNCAFTARMYSDDGTQVWSRDLSALLSRPDRLEIQDVRWDGGVLYFNEACQSYSRGARGRCSSLVALDAREGRVLWRTPPLTSNNVFAVTARYIVCGYGFTSEPDHLFVVRRSDGRVVRRVRLPAAHEELRFVDATTLHVRVSPGEILNFQAEGFEGDAPTLTRIPTP